MKFFIYARKSTEDEARQILSIDAQLDELRMTAGCGHGDSNRRRHGASPALYLLLPEKGKPRAKNG